jgi:hypothetical protein
MAGALCVSKISWLILKSRGKVDVEKWNKGLQGLPGHRQNTSLVDLTAAEKGFIFAS